MSDWLVFVHKLICTGTVEERIQALQAFNNTAVAVGHHRYIRWEDGSEELYDIEADPNEWTNLANDEETSALRERLARHIPKDPAPWRSPVYNHNNYFRETPSQRPAR